jgi:hypothetical protein
LLLVLTCGGGGKILAAEAEVTMVTAAEAGAVGRAEGEQPL